MNAVVWGSKGLQVNAVTPSPNVLRPLDVWDVRTDSHSSACAACCSSFDCGLVLVKLVCGVMMYKHMSRLEFATKAMRVL